MERTGGFADMTVKERHTIVDKWPMGLKKLPGDEGAQQEFDMLLESGSAGRGRYMEWRRGRLEPGLGNQGFPMAFQGQTNLFQ